MYKRQALERYKKGIVLQNRMLWEIQKFYPKEYLLGSEVLSYLNQELNVNLPEEEAGNIAFHIVNAQIDATAVSYTHLRAFRYLTKIMYFR